MRRCNGNTIHHLSLDKEFPHQKPLRLYEPGYLCNEKTLCEEFGLNSQLMPQKYANPEMVKQGLNRAQGR